MKTCLVSLLMLGAPGYAQTRGTFPATGGMAASRNAYTATLLTNGKVLIAGGYKVTPNPPGGPIGSILASAELYDPATGAFSNTGDMATARMFHSATLLPDGKVVIAGGYGSFTSPGVFFLSQPLASAELYDPLTGTFTATGSRPTSLL